MYYKEDLRYYNPKDIDGVGVFIGVENRKLYGNNLKSEKCEELPLYKKEDGHYSWVLSPGGDILYKWNSYLELETKNYTRHSDLNEGEPVICAGEFYLSSEENLSLKELFIELNDSSGHYRPDGKKCFKYVLDKFKALNINTDNVSVFTRDQS